MENSSPTQISLVAKTPEELEVKMMALNTADNVYYKFSTPYQMKSGNWITWYQVDFGSPRHLKQLRSDRFKSIVKQEDIMGLINGI